ncbi:MAG: regulatory protein RecX [Chryseolinea sp.]
MFWKLASNEVAVDFLNIAVEKYRKHLTTAEVKQKMHAYCAYQERSHQEVKNKLLNLGVYGNEIDEMISSLIIDGYLNEERFAKAFAGGKFRVKHWGRLKINRELEARGLTKNCIKLGMREIDDEDYLQTLITLVEKKSDQVQEANPFVRKDKIARFAISKGYEPEMVWKVVQEIIK